VARPGPLLPVRPPAPVPAPLAVPTTTVATILQEAAEARPLQALSQHPDRVELRVEPDTSGLVVLGKQQCPLCGWRHKVYGFPGDTLDEEEDAMDNEPQPTIGETWELLLGSNRRSEEWRSAEILEVEQDQVTIAWPANQSGRLKLPDFRQYIAAGRFRPIVASQPGRS
jgi:hypothetical protein